MSQRHHTRRQRQVRSQIEITQAAARNIQAVANKILRLQRRAWWGRVAWGLVAAQAVLLFPAVVAFASLCHAAGGPVAAVQIVHWFVLETLKDFAR